MRLFKRIDFIIQVILLSGSILLLMICGIAFLFYPYFLLGGWLLISILVHWIFRNNYLAASGRKDSQLVVLGLLLIGALGCLFPSFLPPVAIVILIIFPFLAINYIFTCRNENEMLELRDFFHLK